MVDSARNWRWPRQPGNARRSWGCWRRWPAGSRRTRRRFAQLALLGTGAVDVEVELEVPGRLVGVWIRPSAAQFAPHPPGLPLRQVVQDPPLLVDPTTLDQRAARAERQTRLPLALLLYRLDLQPGQAAIPGLSRLRLRQPLRQRQRLRHSGAPWWAEGRRSRSLAGRVALGCCSLLPGCSAGQPCWSRWSPGRRWCSVTSSSTKAGYAA